MSGNGATGGNRIQMNMLHGVLTSQDSIRSSQRTPKIEMFESSRNQDTPSYHNLSGQNPEKVSDIVNIRDTPMFNNNSSSGWEKQRYVGINGLLNA
jgi:hypothetical protein